MVGFPARFSCESAKQNDETESWPKTTAFCTSLAGLFVAGFTALPTAKLDAKAPLSDVDVVFSVPLARNVSIVAAAGLERLVQLVDGRHARRMFALLDAIQGFR